MTQQQQSLIEALRAIHRDTYAPAKSKALAQRCYMSERNMRYKLVELEQLGAVRRVGQRGGWLPAVA